RDQVPGVDLRVLLEGYGAKLPAQRIQRPANLGEFQWMELYALPIFFSEPDGAGIYRKEPYPEKTKGKGIEECREYLPFWQEQQKRGESALDRNPNQHR